jgi:hypothetical protein
LVRLWREKRGEVEPEDLSDNLIVQLGTVTEQLNRRWYERNTGQVVTEVRARSTRAVSPSARSCRLMLFRHSQNCCKRTRCPVADHSGLLYIRRIYVYGEQA